MKWCQDSVNSRWYLYPNQSPELVLGLESSNILLQLKYHKQAESRPGNVFFVNDSSQSQEGENETYRYLMCGLVVCKVYGIWGVGRDVIIELL